LAVWEPALAQHPGGWPAGNVSRQLDRKLGQRLGRGVQNGQRAVTVRLPPECEHIGAGVGFEKARFASTQAGVFVPELDQPPMPVPQRSGIVALAAHFRPVERLTVAGVAALRSLRLGDFIAVVDERRAGTEQQPGGLRAEFLRLTGEARAGPVGGSLLAQILHLPRYFKTAAVRVLTCSFW
jgi:hypothetical protein